jgi:hypothetical protein
MIGEIHPLAPAGSVLPRSTRLVRFVMALGLATAVGSIMLQQAGPLLPACLFRELTGVSCLTCGLTRSLVAASHGNIFLALRFHLLGPLILAVMLLVCATCAAEALTGRRIARFLNRVRRRQVVLGTAALWIIYGVARAIVELL